MSNNWLDDMMKRIATKEVMNIIFKNNLSVSLQVNKIDEGNYEIKIMLSKEMKERKQK